MTSKKLALALLATAATAVVTGAAVWMIVGAPTRQRSPETHATGLSVALAMPSTCSTESAQALIRRVSDWDTRSQSRQDVIRRVAAVADPSGIETPGLLADLDDYLPNADIWRQLGAYRTRQTLTGIRLAVPRSWARIGDLRERLGAGTAAFTVRATRIRSGVVAGQRATASSEIVLTMFVRCPPLTSKPVYRLLRLSRPGHPLP